MNGHYEPGNVRWATATQQARNKQVTMRITAFGETLTVHEWSERTGIPAKKIEERIRHRMPPEKALSALDLRRTGLHAPRITPQGFIYSQLRTRAA